VVWLDGLDIPLVRAFDASWVSPLRPARVPEPASDAAQAEFRWPWRATRGALEGLAASTPKDRPVTRAYVTLTGAPPVATMGADAHWLRPGERARAGRSTAGRVFHVIEGRGRSRIGETELAWEPGDTFVAPPWHRVLVELRIPDGVRPDGERRRAIARAQDDVLSRLRRTDFRLVRRFESTAFLGLEIGPSALAALRAMGDVVASIVPDSVLRPSDR